jgi:hypothetical protein
VPDPASVVDRADRQIAVSRDVVALVVGLEHDGTLDDGNASDPKPDGRKHGREHPETLVCPTDLDLNLERLTKTLDEADTPSRNVLSLTRPSPASSSADCPDGGAAAHQRRTADLDGPWRVPVMAR